MKFEYELSQEEESGLLHHAETLKEPKYGELNGVISTTLPRDETPEEESERINRALTQVVKARLSELVIARAKDVNAEVLEKLAAGSVSPETAAKIRALLEQN